MINYKKWLIQSKKKPKTAKSLVSLLLSNRGFASKELQEDFLHPRMPQEYSLKELGISAKNMKLALKRLDVAKDKKQKIIIFGDYDADGVTATAILWETLYKLGFDVLPFIPSRFKDGYGLSVESIKKVIKDHKDLSLIITVDNGIVANEAVAYANSKKINVIITDHHKPHKQLPEALTIVHTIKTSGSGVAWVFSREIEKYFSSENSFIDQSVELATIGTIADQLPLTGFNRSLVRFGLEKLRTTKRVGLTALFEVSEIDQSKISTYEVNYGIAPRINASGRIAEATDALRLLCTTNLEKSKKIAEKLNKLNIERQDLVKSLLSKAEQSVGEEKIIVISDKSFHEGVIGLVASRLVEKFYRPTIVLSLSEEHAKASARSIKGFSIVDAINQFRNLIIEGGGHDMAAGFSIKESNIEIFKQSINLHYEKFLDAEILSPKLEIDAQIDLDLVSVETLSLVEQLSPFGIGNKKPLFLTKQCKISETSLIGRDKSHIKFKVSQNGKRYEAIAFGIGEHIDKLRDKDNYDIAYQLDKNVWNGRTSVQLIIKDVRK